MIVFLFFQNGNDKVTFFFVRQRILALELIQKLGIPVKMFGNSIAGGLDVDNNNYDGKLKMHMMIIMI